LNFCAQNGFEKGLGSSLNSIMAFGRKAMMEFEAEMVKEAIGVITDRRVFYCKEYYRKLL